MGLLFYRSAFLLSPCHSALSKHSVQYQCWWKQLTQLTQQFSNDRVYQRPKTYSIHVNVCCLTNICHDEDPFYATHFHTAPTKYEIAHKNIKKYHQHHLFLNCSIFGSYAKMWLERTVWHSVCVMQGRQHQPLAIFLAKQIHFEPTRKVFTCRPVSFMERSAK